MRFDFDSWQGCCVWVEAFGSAITLASIWWNTIRSRRYHNEVLDEVSTLGMRMNRLAKDVDIIYWEISDRPDSEKKRFSRDLYESQGMEE